MSSTKLAFRGITGAIALLALGVVPGEVQAGGDAEAPDRLVVHEWGTFTSMQGSDGVGLEGLQREEERLPPFVYSRTEVRDCPLRAHGYKGLEVPVTHVTQKMETPVLYFHCATPRRVRVRVDFVKGLISQWYPVSDLLGPPEATPEKGPLDLTTVERSFLQWDVDLLPKPGPVPSGIPSVAADDPWSFARDVNAAYVRTVPRKGPDRMGPTEAEHYLFYRGLGTFEVPVAVKASRGSVAEFSNLGEHPIPFAFAIEMRGSDASGSEPVGRYRRIGGGLVAKATVDASLADVPLRPAADAAKDLTGEVAEILQKMGLFEDEARAMVRTWARSWFSSEGTRILYVVPRATTDAILPLEISPAPDRIVRVLVGRLEYLTPEAEADAISALRDRRSADESVRASAEKSLVRFDRFLESVVRRARAASDDPVVRASADELLASLAK